MTCSLLLRNPASDSFSFFVFSGCRQPNVQSLEYCCNPHISGDRNQTAREAQLCLFLISMVKCILLCKCLLKFSSLSSSYRRHLVTTLDSEAAVRLLT